MSRRNKLQKFAEVAAFPNVYENFGAQHALLTCCGKLESMRGRWAKAHFQNQNPITLELACGKGEYTVGLAQLFPDRNVIGVDVKGARIWKGARRALEFGLTNAAFLRTRIEQLGQFFTQGEITEIWIVFPDPFPRDSKASRRLTAPHFLEMYRSVLKPGGIVHLKTDDTKLYHYSLDVIHALDQCMLLYHNADIYSKELPASELGIRTFYEAQHLAEGKKITYIKFCMTSSL